MLSVRKLQCLCLVALIGTERFCFSAKTGSWSYISMTSSDKFHYLFNDHEGIDYSNVILIWLKRQSILKVTIEKISINFTSESESKVGERGTGTTTWRRSRIWKCAIKIIIENPILIDSGKMKIGKNSSPEKHWEQQLVSVSVWEPCPDNNLLGNGHNFVSGRRTLVRTIREGP